MGESRRAQPRTRQFVAKLLEALLDGPVTEYGLPALLGLSSKDGIARCRGYLETFHERGLLEIIGTQPNPRGASKGEHPVYRLKR